MKPEKRYPRAARKLQKLYFVLRTQQQKRSISSEIQTLSSLQKKLRNVIESTNNKGRRKQLEGNRKSTKYQTAAIMINNSKKSRNTKKIPINVTRPSVKLIQENPKNHLRSMTIASI